MTRLLFQCLWGAALKKRPQEQALAQGYSFSDVITPQMDNATGVNIRRPFWVGRHVEEYPRWFRALHLYPRLHIAHRLYSGAVENTLLKYSQTFPLFHLVGQFQWQGISKRRYWIQPWFVHSQGPNHKTPPGHETFCNDYEDLLHERPSFSLCPDISQLTGVSHISIIPHSPRRGQCG